MCNKIQKQGYRILKNWGLVLLSSWMIGFVSLFIIHSKHGISDVIKVIFPIVFEEYWFMTAFIGVLLISPWINKFVSIISIKALSKLLLVTLFMQSVIPTFTGCETWFSNFAFFIFLYMTGAYINKLSLKEKISDKVLIISFCICFIIMWSISLIIWKLSAVYPFLSRYINYFSVSAESVFIFFAACSLFLFVLRRKEFTSKSINNLAGNIIGAYLFQSHIFISSWLWENIDLQLDCGSILWLPSAFVVCIVIMIVGAVLGCISTTIVDTILKSKIGNIVVCKLDSIFVVT